MLITLYRPDGEVIEFENAKSAAFTHGLLEFRHQKDETDLKGKSIRTSLPFLIEEEVQM